MSIDLGVPSPFFPGILLLENLRKPKENCRFLGKNDGWKRMGNHTLELWGLLWFVPPVAADFIVRKPPKKLALVWRLGSRFGCLPLKTGSLEHPPTGARVEVFGACPLLAAPPEAAAEAPQNCQAGHVSGWICSIPPAPTARYVFFFRSR